MIPRLLMSTLGILLTVVMICLAIPFLMLLCAFLLRVLLLSGLLLLLALLPSLLLSCLGSLIFANLLGNRLLKLEAESQELRCGIDSNSGIYTLSHLALLLGNLGLCFCSSQLGRDWLTTTLWNPLSNSFWNPLLSWPILEPLAWWLACALALGTMAWLLDQAQSRLLHRCTKSRASKLVPEDQLRALAALAAEEKAAAQGTPWSKP